jgi:2-phospho-L-lactate guanylyltransferase
VPLGHGVWVVVLIKDFTSAKQRLAPALDPAARSRLARDNAARALNAARAGSRILAVAGSGDAANLARLAGAEVLLEARPEGQNPAARRGIDHAVRRGARAVVLLSSDLPRVTRRAVAGLIRAGEALDPPAVVAAPAIGRGGTNALYLKPPGCIGLHFGADSLALFTSDAAAHSVRFLLRRSSAFSLDLDEPADLARLERAG